MRVGIVVMALLLSVAPARAAEVSVSDSTVPYGGDIVLPTNAVLFKAATGETNAMGWFRRRHAHRR